MLSLRCCCVNRLLAVYPKDLTQVSGTVRWRQLTNRVQKGKVDYISTWTTSQRGLQLELDYFTLPGLNARVDGGLRRLTAAPCEEISRVQAPADELDAPARKHA